MNQAMYHHPATQKNLASLRDRAVHVLGPNAGFQACGTEGDGRMSEPEQLVEELEKFFRSSQMLQGKKVLVTAGGTQEPLDPVRYLGNRSSGRMGYAVAQVLQEAGAETTLISAPVELPAPPGVRLIPVMTALEMYDAVMKYYQESDVVVKAAAVADYRPSRNSEHKIKKDGQNLQLELVPNPDILAELGKKKTHQLLIGFAAETENLVEHARAKIRSKNLDLLVANDVTLPGAGFGSITNIVSFLFPDGRRIDYPQMRKLEIAGYLVDEIAILLGVKQRSDKRG